MATLIAGKEGDEALRRLLRRDEVAGRLGQEHDAGEVVQRELTAACTAGPDRALSTQRIQSLRRTLTDPEGVPYSVSTAPLPEVCVSVSVKLPHPAVPTSRSTLPGTDGKPLEAGRISQPREAEAHGEDGQGHDAGQVQPADVGAHGPVSTPPVTARRQITLRAGPPGSAGTAAGRGPPCLRLDHGH